MGEHTTVHEDLLGATISQKGGVFEATRKFLVEGLTATDSAWKRQMEAITAETIPASWDVWPGTDGDPLRVPGVVVQNKTATLISPQIAEVTVEYGPPDAVSFQREPGSDSGGIGEGQASVSATTLDVEVDKDVFGNPIQVFYLLGLPEQNRKTKATVSKRTISLRFTRSETVPPFAWAKDYAGKANDALLTGSITDPKWSWMCTGISFDSVNGGAWYRVTYEFVRLGTYVILDSEISTSWNGTPFGELVHPGAGNNLIVPGAFVSVAWVDQSTGDIPEGAILGDGFDLWRVYEDANFQALGI